MLRIIEVLGKYVFTNKKYQIQIIIHKFGTHLDKQQP